MKTILRTLFYQFLLLFVGGTLGFILNAEYIGWKSIIIERSIQNIFFPIPYSPEVEAFVLNIGRMRLYTYLNGNPYIDSGVKILDEFVWNEEVYIVLYEYTDSRGKKTKNEYTTRVRWKSWEYYYELPAPGGSISPVPPPEPPKPPAENANAQFRQPIPGPVFLPPEAKDDRRPWCR